MKASNSRIQVYQTCQRKYKLRYVDRIYQRKFPHYLTFGNAVHKFFESFYSRLPNAPKQIKKVFAAVDKSLLSKDEIEAMVIQEAIAQGIASSYAIRYAGDFEKYQNFITEKEGVVPVGNHTLEGRLDVLSQDKDGDWWVIDHKTASFINSDYIERAKMDWQILGYMLIGKELLGGKWPKGVVYNLIKKPAIRLRSAESIASFTKRIEEEYTQYADEKSYFTRQEVLIGKSTLTEYLAELNEMLNMIDSQHKRDSSWPKSTGSCIGKYGSCEYMPICTSGQVNKLMYKQGEN